MRPCNCDKCYVCWLWYHNPEWRVQHGGPSEAVAIPDSVLKHGPDSIIRPNPHAPYTLPAFHFNSNATLSGIARPNRCEFLLARSEFKAGCNGWKCRHDCEHKLPAVPGVYCQTCTFYHDSGDKF